MQWANLSVSDIDWDDLRFCLSLSLPESFPVSGLEEEGEILYPFLVRPGIRKGTWTIVFGYSLAAAERDRGKETISALCLTPSDADERKSLRIGYAFRLRFGPLSLLEKAFLARRLLEVGKYTEEELVRCWLKPLQLPPLPGTVDRLLRLADWPPSLLRSVESQEMNPAVLLSLAESATADAETLIPFLLRYRWSHSRQKEVLRICQDLAKIQGKALREICRECDSADSRLPEELVGPPRAEAIRHYLLGLRYPHRREKQDRYQECRRSLPLPPEIHLTEPADFEGENFRIQFSFRNRREFDRAVDSLNRLSREEGFEDLFQFV
jgi:hypothetical protein